MKGALGIYRGQRGRMQIEVTVVGRSCHGSMPFEGLNPLEHGGAILAEAARRHVAGRRLRRPPVPRSRHPHRVVGRCSTPRATAPCPIGSRSGSTAASPWARRPSRRSPTSSRSTRSPPRAAGRAHGRRRRAALHAAHVARLPRRQRRRSTRAGSRPTTTRPIERRGRRLPPGGQPPRRRARRRRHRRRPAPRAAGRQVDLLHRRCRLPDPGRRHRRSRCRPAKRWVVSGARHAPGDVRHRRRHRAEHPPHRRVRRRRASCSTPSPCWPASRARSPTTPLADGSEACGSSSRSAATRCCSAASNPTPSRNGATCCTRQRRWPRSRRAHELIVTHGNGPQVGVLAMESAADPMLSPPVPARPARRRDAGAHRLLADAEPAQRAARAPGGSAAHAVRGRRRRPGVRPPHQVRRADVRRGRSTTARRRARLGRRRRRRRMAPRGGVARAARGRGGRRDRNARRRRSARGVRRRRRRAGGAPSRRRARGRRGRDRQGPHRRTARRGARRRRTAAAHRRGRGGDSASVTPDRSRSVAATPRRVARVRRSPPARWARRSRPPAGSSSAPAGSLPSARWSRPLPCWPASAAPG